MWLRVLLGPSEEDLVRAQWEVVDELERAAGEGWRYAGSSRRLRQLVRQAREQADSPSSWARAFARLLQDTLTAAQEAEEMRAGVELLECRLASFQRIVAGYNANPLQAQVETLTQERDEWQAQAERHAGRVRSLEAALARGQQAHQEEVARLKQEIVALNRLVVQQQEELVQGNP
jgi:uncharacterized protein YukE